MRPSKASCLALLSLPLAVLACDAQPDDPGSKRETVRLEGTDQEPHGDGVVEPTNHSLVSRNFRLDHATGYEPVEGVPMEISFPTLDQVKFIFGCNLHYADYNVDGNKLIVSNIGHYQVGCEPGVVAQEVWFREFLQSEPILELSERQMVLSRDSHSFSFVEFDLQDPGVGGAGTR